MSNVNEVNSQETQEIGVFWVYSGVVLGVAHPISLGEERVEGLVDSPLDHSSIWDAAFHLRYGFNDLNQVEYHCVPRGRVLHARGTGPLVYLDRTLIKTETKCLIASFFGFPVRAATWRTDPHYTTCLPDLDRLFTEL